jgi:hypothetical protein
MRSRNLIVLEKVIPGEGCTKRKTAQTSNVVASKYATNSMIVFSINVHDMMVSHKNQFAFQIR